MHYYIFYLQVILFIDVLHRIVEQSFMSNLKSEYMTRSENKPL